MTVSSREHDCVSGQANACAKMLVMISEEWGRNFTDFSARPRVAGFGLPAWRLRLTIPVRNGL
jgi:hypothetical protein